ncbi:MAG TPA: hypothetical protein VF574_04035 [Allosphingosinicella sp.]|jgi:hypothetical protein
MSVLALLLPFAAAAPAVAGPAAAERSLLDAFKSACSRTGNDVEAMKSDAAASGWAAMADDGDPRVGRLLKMGREAVDQESKSSAASFRRILGGRDIFLIVSRYEDKSGYWGVGCRLYDFDAPSHLSPNGLEAWMGRPPTGVQIPVPGLEKKLWEPGWSDGITVEISYVPKDNPVGKTYGLSGNVLVAQAIGGF